MDTGQRLAAYLGGDLDADERAALEAELAGDPALRARLDRIRRADELLAHLPDVDLPEGFATRLDAALAPALEEVLGDELAVARARRRLPTWFAPAGAAAALLAVVGTGMVLSGIVGGADNDMVAMDAPGAESLSDADAGIMEQDSAPFAMGPVVVTTTRVLSDEALADLAADPTVADGALAWLATEDADTTSLAWARALAPTADGEFDGSRSARQYDDGPPDSDDPLPPPMLAAVDLQGTVSADDLDAVGTCLPVLFEDARAPVIPLRATLGVDEESRRVIAYVALTADADGDLARVEVWLVARDTCDVLAFRQQDR